MYIPRLITAPPYCITSAQLDCLVKALQAHQTVECVFDVFDWGHPEVDYAAVARQAFVKLFSDRGVDVKVQWEKPVKREEKKFTYHVMTVRVALVK